MLSGDGDPPEDPSSPAPPAKKVAFPAMEPETTAIPPLGVSAALRSLVRACARCGHPCFWTAIPPHCLRCACRCDVCLRETACDSGLLHCDGCGWHCCPDCSTKSFPPAAPAVDVGRARFHCPVTRQVMRQPLMDREGHNFEGCAIREWLSHDPHCPVDADVLGEADLFPNRALQEEIEEWQAGMAAASGDLPERFLCPITQDVMREPVMDREGHNFDRPAIYAWLQRHCVCPIGREPLEADGLFPNAALADAIAEWQTAHPPPAGPDGRRLSSGSWAAAAARRGSRGPMSCLQCNQQCAWTTSLPYNLYDFRCHVCALWHPVRQALLRCPACQWNCCLACYRFRAAEGPRGNFSAKSMVVVGCDPNKRTDVQCAHCRAACLWAVPSAAAAAEGFHCGLCDRVRPLAPGVYYCDGCDWACCSPCAAPLECQRCRGCGWRVPRLPHVGECRRCFSPCAAVGLYYGRCECGWQVCAACAEGTSPPTPGRRVLVALRHARPTAAPPPPGPLCADRDARYACFLLLFGAFVPFLWCMAWPLLRSRRRAIRLLGAVCLLCWLGELALFAVVIAAYARH